MVQKLGVKMTKEQLNKVRMSMVGNVINDDNDHDYDYAYDYDYDQDRH